MPSETIHIISMDGGGIYGLATARMLRKLCERDPAFLAKSDIASYRFAGTSAGALNALLLAKEEDPRAFVLAGGLDDYWRNTLVFQPPDDWWSLYWSFLGITPWFGSSRYQQSLEELFGATTLDTIAHKVFVALFDEIDRAVETTTAESAIDAALGFIQGNGWRKGVTFHVTPP